MKNVAECTGCGYCCVSVTCIAGQEKYGGKKPCEGLIWSIGSKRHFCKLCLGENQAGYFYRKALHVGAGCCSNLNSWRREPLKDRTKTILSGSGGFLESPIPEVMQHFLTALGRGMVSSDMIKLTMVRFEGLLQQAGYDKETVKIYSRWASKYALQNRSSSTEGFMG